MSVAREYQALPVNALNYEKPANPVCGPDKFSQVGNYVEMAKISEFDGVGCTVKRERCRQSINTKLSLRMLSNGDIHNNLLWIC